MGTGYLSRRSLCVKSAAGLLAVASSVTVTAFLPGYDGPDQASRGNWFDLLRSAYGAPGDARVIGRAWLHRAPHEMSAATLSHALFGDLLPTSVGEIRERIAAARDADFGSGRVLVLGGWLMALTEARWCALAVLIERQP
jgi:hypothetical protein